MPCYDGQNQPRETIIYRDGVDPAKVDRKVRHAMDKVHQYEGALCAVFNELDRRGIAGDVAAKSSRSGLIDIMDWYVNHKKDDQSKVLSDLHKYSIDEQRVMLDILKRQFKD